MLRVERPGSAALLCYQHEDGDVAAPELIDPEPIEDASDEEAQRCKQKLMGGDKNASPGATRMSPVIIRTEERLNDVVSEQEPLLRKEPHVPSEGEREALVYEMLSVLQDAESEGYYRRLAATVPKDIIFEALSLVRRAVQEGKIRKSRGALFVAIVKRACADRGVVVNESPVGVRQDLHG